MPSQAQLRVIWVGLISCLTALGLTGCRTDPTLDVTGDSLSDDATSSEPDSASQIDDNGIVREPGLAGGDVAKSDDEVGLVIVPDMRLPASRYKALATTLEEELPFIAYVKVAEFPLDVATSLTLESAVEDQAKKIRSAAEDLDALFVMGHGEGAMLLQDFTAERPKAYDGQILLGGAVKRSLYKKAPVLPTLSVAAELDGVSYVTRQAEAYHKVIEEAEDPEAAALAYPIVLIEGMTHMQFASGKPVGYSEGKDLVPDLSLSAAHGAVAEAVAAFVRYRLAGDIESGEALLALVEQAGAFFAPLIEGLDLEGSAHFKPPCNCAPLTCPESEECQARNPWTEVAQEYMGGLEAADMAVRDSFHPVAEMTPVHLPKIYNTCEADEDGCVLEVTTVTENLYGDGDNEDDGRSPNAATEIRAKLMSRQSVYRALGVDAPLSETDPMLRCAEINQLAWEWALQHASPRSRDRFDEWGVPMQMGGDKGPYNMGPLWIWTALEYEMKKGLFGEGVTQVMQVSSPCMVTPWDFSIAQAAGFHYCKLLSPARALEWIYVDGLRARLSAK